MLQFLRHRLLITLVLFTTILNPVLASEKRCNDLDDGFIAQRDSYSCGPIAIVNAIKAMNYSLDEMAWFRYLSEYCGTSPNGGTYGGNLEEGIKVIINETGITYRKKTASYLRDLDSELVNDNVVLVFSRSQSHFFVVAYKRDGKYFSLNRYSGVTAKQFTTEKSMSAALGGNNASAILYILQKAR